MYVIHPNMHLHESSYSINFMLIKKKKQNSNSLVS